MPDTADAILQMETGKLIEALRAQVAGAPCGEASVELLVNHDYWLDRPAFRQHVKYVNDPDVTGGGAMAQILWGRAIEALNERTLHGSGAAEKILQIAASLGGGVPVDLRSTMVGLGEAHAAYVLTALAHVNRRAG